MMGDVFQGWEVKMRSLLMLGVLGLVGCGSDAGVKVFNSAPEANITSHDDGAGVKEAAEIIFRGVGSDLDDSQTDLEGSWQLNAEPLCDWAPLSEEGLSECALTVTTELEEITFLVRDPKDSIGSTTISLNITDDIDPHAEITSPGFDPATDEELPFFWGDEPVELVGVVSDEEDEPDTLTVEWTSDSDEELGITPPDSSGTTRASAYLAEGIHTITLTVTDSAGNYTSDTLDIQVGPDNPAGAPDVVITFPDVVIGGRPFYYGDQAIEFQGLVTDDEDAAETLSITWSSDTDGEIIATTPNSDGTTGLTAHLTQGLHTITLTATDSDGQVGSDAINIEVGPDNTPPNCVLLTPTEGESGIVGDLVVFGGTVGDPDIPVDTLTVEWKDGELVVGASIPTTAGNVSLPLTELTTGAHVISMIVSDEMGATCTDQVTYIVREPNNPPIVTIDSPTPGEVATEGDPVLFDATVSDAEDAPGDLSVEWTSDLDGVLSTAPADSSGFSRFTDTTLAEGIHTITLTVTDTDGAYTTGVLLLEVEAAPEINTAPTVTLISPADGHTVAEGDAVLFSAVVNDAEDAPSALTITWTSSIDGVLTGATPDGSGAVSFSETEMSVGTHIISITVADTEGLIATTMAVLNVETSGDDPDDEEDDFLEEGDELPPELEGGTYTGCAGFDLDNLTIFGSIDAALFCACGFDEADNVKISSSGDDDIDLDCLDVIGGDLEIDLSDANTIDLSSVASVGDGVNIHDNYDTEVIDLSAMTSIGGSFNISSNVDLETLNIAALETIDGSMQLNSNNSLATFTAPSLLLVEGSIQVNSNNGLEELQFDSLETVEGELRMEWNNNVQALSLPNMTVLDGQLYLYYNEQLETVHMDQLIEIGSSLQIQNNYAIEELTLPELVKVNGSFSLSSLNQVSEIQLPALEEVNGSFNITNISQVEVVSAPLFYDLSGSLTIRDNGDLSTVDLSSLPCLDDFTVVGNNMSPDDLYALLLQLSCDEGDSEVVFRTSDAETLCSSGEDVVVGDLYIYAIDPEPLDLSCIVDITGRLEIEFSDSPIINLSRAAGVGDFINIHDNYDTEEVWLDSMVSTGGSFTLSGNVSLDVLNLDGLEDIGGQLSVNSNQSLDTLYAANLQLVQGSMQFNSNNGLELVDMPNVFEIEGELRMEWNNNIQDLFLPDLMDLGGQLYLYYNEQLSTVDFDNLIEVGSSVQVQNNYQVETISLTNLQSVNGSFSISSANQMSTLNLPELLEVNGSFTLNNNSQVESFEAAKFADLSGSLTIRDNSDLQTVDLSSLECLDDFTIVGNDLTIDSHHALLIALTCSADGSLMIFRASDADDFCATGETIVGDLYISPIDTGHVDLSCITSVTGKVEMEYAKSSSIDLSGTVSIGENLDIHDNYDPESIDFSSLVSVGEGFSLSSNRDLSLLTLSSLETVDGQISINSNNSLDTFSAPSLSLIEGSLQINSNNGIEEIVLDNLETIEGEVRLEWNNNIQLLSMPNLTEISGQLYLYYNESLDTVDLSSVTEIESSLQIQNNYQLETVYLSSLVTVNGSLSISSANQLEALNLDELQEVNGSFTVSNCSSMASLYAPNFNDLAGSLTIRDNGDLASLDLSTLTCVDDYTIVGNDLDDDDRRDLLLHIISDC